MKQSDASCRIEFCPGSLNSSRFQTPDKGHYIGPTNVAKGFSAFQVVLPIDRQGDSVNPARQATRESPAPSECVVRGKLESQPRLCSQAFQGLLDFDDAV